MVSRSKSNKERARRAIDAMTALGFSKKEATPVLKSLLKLFDDCWEPIEDECYRTLADAILDARDRPQVQVAEHGSHSARMVAPEEDQHRPSTSLVVHGGPRDLDSETEAPLIKRTRTNSNNLSADHSTGPQLFPSSSVAAQKRARQMMDEDFQHAVFLREPKPEPDMDATQSFHDTQVGIASHPFNTSFSGVANPYPLEVRPPDQNQSEISGHKGRPIPRCRTRTSSSSFAEPTDSMERQPQNQESSSDHAAATHNTGTGPADEYSQETPSLHTVVASSTTGEVKMSIKCSVDPSKFRMPNLEEVFSMVEDKCFRSFTGLPPKFSIGSLMNEVCQCVAQLGNDHAAECNVQSDSFDNGGNLQKECMSGATLAEPIACMNSGGGKYKSVEDSSILETSENGQANSTVDQHLALSQLRNTHDASDISKGKEKVRIPVANEFGSEKCPPFFHYIQRNLVSQKASANISTARTGDEDGCAQCFGNCLSALIPCACAIETGGEFAYTQDGLVRSTFLDECFFVNLFPEKHHKFFYKPLKRPGNEAPPEPSRGCLVRKFIKECGSKCGCNMQCGNRVVQSGISCNLQVFSTREGKGWGLRTLDELPKGAFVCEYVGELLTNMELRERTSRKALKAGNMYPVDLDTDCSEGVLKDEEALCLDATFYGNVGRFINHRCYDANLFEIPVEVETPDYHYYHLALFTSKKVEAFEELTWDYGIDFDDDKHPGRAFQCLCGSKYCRGQKRRRNRGKAAAK